MAAKNESGTHEDAMLYAGRWQSQERAQLLKGKKLHERQLELEDALIDLKVGSSTKLSMYSLLVWLAGSSRALPPAFL